MFNTDKKLVRTYNTRLTKDEGKIFDLYALFKGKKKSALIREIIIDFLQREFNNNNF